MMSEAFLAGRLKSRGGLILLLAAWCVALACDGRPPTDADPKPPGRDIILTLREVNDSTLAYDVVMVDTAPIKFVISILEKPGATARAPWGFGYPATVETTFFSPPRYTVRLSHTFSSRQLLSYYSWTIIGEDLNGQIFFRTGQHYFGPKTLSLDVPGIPTTMQHVGLELTLVPRGPYGVAHAVAYVDSGTPAQRSFGPVRADSAYLPGSSPYVFGVNRTNPNIHLWIPGPLPNGPHSLTFVVTDDSGRVATFKKAITVDVPSRTYRVVPIVVAGAIDTYATGINNAGAVAVTYRLPDSTTRAMRWSNGVGVPLPGPAPAAANRINDADVVAGYVGRVGRSGENTPGDSIVVWRDTARSAVAIGYGYLDATAISNDGTVLVNRNLIRNGVLTNLPLAYASDMNNSAVAVGYNFDIGPPNVAAGANPASFRVGSPYDINGPYMSPHCCPSTARFINDAGQVFGSNQSGVFMWSQQGGASWLVNPLGRGTVEAISRGNLVLSRLTDGSIAVWTIGGVTTRVVPNDLQWTIDALTGINNKGQIIAHGVNRASGQKAALFLDPM